jgi:hypothetical protein
LALVWCCKKTRLALEKAVTSKFQCELANISHGMKVAGFFLICSFIFASSLIDLIDFDFNYSRKE